MSIWNSLYSCFSKLYIRKTILRSYNYKVNTHFFSRENPNIQDRYGNRYDPRFHSIPGEYDPENDPRFSDPRYQDPRNVPKYNNNRQRQPQDRYDR